MKKNNLDDALFLPYMETISHEIHQSKNRVRDAMNSALIAIGIRNAVLRGRASAVARRVGKVEVDHGETGCNTPDAESYIHKILARTAKK